MPRRDLEKMVAGASAGKVHLAGFRAWLDVGGEKAQRLRMTIARENPGGHINWRFSSAAEIFNELDKDGRGFIPVNELRLFGGDATCARSWQKKEKGREQ